MDRKTSKYTNIRFRKNATNLILAPYLVNIKKLSYQQSFDILTEWLKKCNSFKKLDFNPDYLVKYALTTAIQKRIPPMKLITLMDRNLELYNVVHKKSLRERSAIIDDFSRISFCQYYCF